MCFSKVRESGAITYTPLILLIRQIIVHNYTFLIEIKTKIICLSLRNGVQVFHPWSACLHGHLGTSSPTVQPRTRYLRSMCSEALPYIRQQYSRDGCKNLCAADDKHEEYCGFRTVTCWRVEKTDCYLPVEGREEKTVKLNQMLWHMEEHRPSRVVLKTREGSFCFPEFDPYEDRWRSETGSSIA